MIIEQQIESDNTQKILLDITIPGKPISNNTKHYYNKYLKRVISYKPPKVIEYKKAIQIKTATYIRKNNISSTKAPVAIYLHIKVKIPKSYSKKKQNELFCTFAPVKPDSDNCNKLIQDAISKDKGNQKNYLLENDSQVCYTSICKTYAFSPQIRLIVKELVKNKKIVNNC